MYSEYKLNKQDDNIQPWCTPFPIWKAVIVIRTGYWIIVNLISYQSQGAAFEANQKKEGKDLSWNTDIAVLSKVLRI